MGAFTAYFQQEKGLARLWEVFPQARLVGGCVRDALLGGTPEDFDLAVPLTPEEMMERLEKQNIRFFPTGLAHGTVTALVLGKAYELTSLRRDVETDGRHAKVAWTADWQEDAKRRDFTMNAMSVDKEGHLYDYFGGEADLKAGIVRFVGDSEARIKEDYLRILRYFRFSARFDKNPPDPAILEKISRHVQGLSLLAKERIRHEFSKILLSPNVVRTLEDMEKTGVLAMILPFHSISFLKQGLSEGVPEDFLLRLFILCPDKEKLAEAFPLSRKEQKRLAFWTDFEKAFQLFPEKAVLLDWLDRYGRKEVLLYSFFAACYVQKGEKSAWGDLRQRIEEMPLPEFPVTGRDLLEKGLCEGKEIGQMLARMRLYWLREEGRVDKEKILAHFEREFQG